MDVIEGAGQALDTEYLTPSKRAAGSRPPSPLKRPSPTTNRGASARNSPRGSSPPVDADTLLAETMEAFGETRGEELRHFLSSLTFQQTLNLFARQQMDHEETVAEMAMLLDQRLVLEQFNTSLAQDFNSAKARVDLLMAGETRMEEELSGRMETLEKLRASIRAADKVSRDAQTRYREQSESFDSERQSWLDQEQHYKLRIANLSTPRKIRPAQPESSELEVAPQVVHLPGLTAPSPNPSLSNSTLELETLQEQLTSLTVAHDSLGTSFRAAQIELRDVKRLYNDVQEENESYELLLAERTMNGELRSSALFRQSWTETEEEDQNASNRGLESVGETSDEELEDEDQDDEDTAQQAISSSPEIHINSLPTQHHEPRTRRRKISSRTITRETPSGGMDLAAELEAAQLADGEGDYESEEKKKKKLNRKSSGDIEVLRAELKSLREANKALTLYVSKIVDRVCSQEGFEKVLAVDFRASPQIIPADPVSPASTEATLVAAPTPATLIKPLALKPDPAAAPPKRASPPVTRNKGHTRPLSLDWKSVSSVFSSALSRTPPTPAYQPTGFKPLLLDPSAAAATAPVRHPSTDEDEDDIRERERLRAEMALHGIKTSSSGWGRPSIETSATMKRLSTGSSTSNNSKRLSIGPGSHPPLTRSNSDSRSSIISLQARDLDAERKVLEVARRGSGTGDFADYGEMNFRRASETSSLGVDRRFSHARDRRSVSPGASLPYLSMQYTAMQDAEESGDLGSDDAGNTTLKASEASSMVHTLSREGVAPDSTGAQVEVKEVDSKWSRMSLARVWGSGSRPVVAVDKEAT